MTNKDGIARLKNRPSDDTAYGAITVSDKIEDKESRGEKILAFRTRIQGLLNHPKYKLAQKIVWAICIVWAGCIVAQSVPYYVYISEGKQAALTGNFVQAEDLFTAALNESKNDDVSDPRLANALNNLGELYRKQGKFDKAAPIYARLLANVEKLPANKKQEKAMSLNSVAAFYRDKGDYKKSEMYLNNALSVWQDEVKKLNDQNYAALLTSKGKLCKEQGRYKESEDNYLKGLKIREALNGKDHPETATALMNLSALYRKVQKYSEAEHLARRALQIDEHALGKQHPDTATDENNLAGLFREMKRYPESEPLYLHALNTRLLLLGKDSPQTAKSLLGLGELRRAQGRNAEAEKLIQEALETDKRVYGTDNHPDCADCLNALAMVYFAQNKLDLAHDAIEKCLSIRRKFLPANHVDLAESLSNEQLIIAKK